MRGYLCDPRKHKDCPKKHCWRNGGLCKITIHWEFATDDEQDKYKDEKPNDVIECYTPSVV